MECPELNEYGSLDQCSQTVGLGGLWPSFCWVVKLTGSVRLCVSRVKQASTGGALLAPSPLQQYPLTFINQASASNL